MSIVSISDKTVEYIRWGMIPPNEHLDLLANIEVGHCVYSLPVQVSDGTKYVLFPLPPYSEVVLFRYSNLPPKNMRFKRSVYICEGLAIDVWMRVA